MEFGWNLPLFSHMSWENPMDFGRVSGLSLYPLAAGAAHGRPARPERCAESLERHQEGLERWDSHSVDIHGVYDHGS